MQKFCVNICLLQVYHELNANEQFSQKIAHTFLIIFCCVFLQDLRERLWDICDKRKEEAEQERAGVIDDGWLDDHTAVLINHYSALMQVTHTFSLKHHRTVLDEFQISWFCSCLYVQIEVGRFQDSLCLLRDYYTAMCKTAFPESTRGFTRVPLIDITADDHVELEEPKM